MSSFLGSVIGGLGGGAIGSAAVQLYLDSAVYQEQLAAAQGETAAAAGEMESTTAGAGAAMTAAYAAAGLAAAVFAKNSVEAAISLQQSTDKLNNSIANSSKVSLSSYSAYPWTVA